MTTLNQVADYFIDTSIKWKEKKMTNIRLQKLIYYAQGWFLQRHSKPLFDEKFINSKYGPLIPSLHEKYKGYGRRIISDVSEGYTPENFDADELETLNDVMYTYGKYTNAALINRFCILNGPCSRVRYQEVIPNHMIKTAFDRFAPLQHMSDDPNLFSSILIVNTVPSDWD